MQLRDLQNIYHSQIYLCVQYINSWKLTGQCVYFKLPVKRINKFTD